MILFSNISCLHVNMKRFFCTYLLGFFASYSEGSATIAVPAAGNCGDDTVLTCKVTGSIGSTSWVGVGRSIVINGIPILPEDNNKYSETRGTSSFTLIIHNTDLTDEGEYKCANGFDESQLKRLNLECKASAADISVTNGKKVSITVDKLYPSSPAFSASFKKENTDVSVAGSRSCSNSTQYSGYYRCVWSSSNSLADGSYTYSIIVATITQAGPLTGSFKIVPPKSPVILNTSTLDDNRTVLYGNEGQTLTIQCTSTGGNPIPTVAWYKDSISSSNQLTSSSSGSLQNEGTYNVTLSHTFTPTATDDKKTLICRSYYPQADSAYRGSKTTTVMLYIRSSTTLTVPAAGNCGDDIVLTCQVTGSTGSTSWFGVGRSIVINGIPTRPEDNNKYTETRGTSSFSLTIHNTDLTDESEYKCANEFDESQLKHLNIECKASAADLSVTNGKKISITVDKLYPSSPIFGVLIRKENTDVPVAGSRTCSSSTQYSGYYRCAWSSSNSLADGSYTYSIVVTTITQADPLTGTFKIVPPKFPVILNTSTLDDNRIVPLNVGQLHTIQCTSTGGNPTPTVAWYKDSVSVSNQLTSSSSGSLQNDGTYTVTVSHTFTPTATDDKKRLICRSFYPQAESAYRGSETTTVMLYLRVAVQSFSINGNSSKNSVTVDEHDADLQFICVVDKFPASSIKISFNGDVLAERLNQKSLSFTRPDVACLDAGVYICEAEDEYGYVPSKSITLFVKCSPRPFRQAPSNFTSNLHVLLTLSFDVIAHPEPGPKGFTWYKKGDAGWIPLLGNVDLKIASTGLHSNLTLINVSKEDFGQYKVIASNSIGSYEHQLFVFENAPMLILPLHQLPKNRESSAIVIPLVKTDQLFKNTRIFLDMQTLIRTRMTKYKEHKSKMYACT